MINFDLNLQFHHHFLLLAQFKQDYIIIHKGINEQVHFNHYAPNNQPIYIRLTTYINSQYFKYISNFIKPMDERPHLNNFSGNVVTQALLYKSKSKLNIDDFLKLLFQYIEYRKKHYEPTRNSVNRESLTPADSTKYLMTINDRGIFLSVMAELLYKSFLSFQIQIKTLSVEFEFKNPRKKAKPRRKGSDDSIEFHERKRKRNKHRKRGDTLKNVANNLEDLSNDSLSNPSNIERPRTQIQRKQDSSHADSNKDKPDENSQGSKGSKQSKGSDDADKNNLKLELNKITQEIRGHEQTYMTGLDDFQNIIPLEQNSQSYSNSVSNPEEIKNLDEKLQILSTGKAYGQSTRKKTGNKRNPSGSTNQRRTKKKGMTVTEEVLDETLQETKIEITDVTMAHNMSSLNNSDIKLEMMEDNDRLEITNKSAFQNFRMEYQPEIFVNTAHISHFFTIENSRSHQKIDMAIFRDDQKVQALRDFFTHYNANNRVDDGQPTFQQDQMDGYIDMGYPDYTMSQPITDLPEYKTAFMQFDDKQIKEELEANKNNKTSLRQIVQKTDKNPSMVFYQLLWQNQREHLILQQERPEDFGDIYIEQF